MSYTLLGLFSLLVIELNICTCAKDSLFFAHGSAGRLTCPLVDDYITWTGPPNRTLIAFGEMTHKGNLRALKKAPHFILEIRNFAEKDEGKYVCESTHTEHSFVVALLKGPSNMTIDYETSNGCIYGYVGREIRLTCRAVSGTPKGTIYWKYNNIVVEISKSSSVTYVFTPSIADNFGVFSCEANNSLILQRNIKICLYYPPNVWMTPGPFFTVIEETKVELRCIYKSNLTITSISWVYNGETINNWLNSTLVKLGSINRTQAGEYCCIVENQAGAKTANVTIQVLHQPEVSISYNKIDGKRELKCNAAGVPDRYDYSKWEHKTEFGTHLRYLPSNTNGIVSIPNITNETDRHFDRGIYVCNVSNNVSFDGKTNVLAEYWLNITGKPYFVTSNKVTQYGILNQTTGLTADIVNFKKPINAVLFIDDMYIGNHGNIEQLQVRDTVYNKNVFVNGIRLTFQIFVRSTNDFRPYTVFVNNTHGSSNYTINLNSASRPDPPSSLYFVRRKNEIAISWKPGFHGGYKQNFFVEYRSKKENIWKTLNASGDISNNTTTVVNNLEPGTEYFIRMFSQNRINASDYTRQYLVETETESRFGVILVIFVILFALISVSCLLYQYKTGKLKDIRNSSCIRFIQVFRAEGIGGVENDMYDMQNNIQQQQQPQDDNPDVPVYSSIDRRHQLSIGSAVSYSVTKKRKPNPLGPRMGQKSDELKKRNHCDVSTSNEHGKQDLNYIEVCFDPKPNDYPFKIHGLEKKTDYTEVDFTQKVDQPPDSDKDDMSDDGFASAEVLSMKRKTKNLKLQ